jgi:hypothetical protein
MTLFLNVPVTKDHIMRASHRGEWCPIACALRDMGCEYANVSYGMIHIKMHGQTLYAIHTPQSANFIFSYDGDNVVMPQVITGLVFTAPPSFKFL